MYKKIENLNKKLQEADVEIDFLLYLNKKEREFLKYIIAHYSEIEEHKIKIPISEVLKVIKIPPKELFSFLEKLSKKSFRYRILIEEREVEGVFFYITSFFIADDKIVLYLPYELSERKRKMTLLSIMNFASIYYFLNKYTFLLYSYFFYNFLIKKSFEVSYEELKNILKIKDNYERFYDFEKKVLCPVIEDLSNFYKIDYKKIKAGDNINNKIVGIRFEFRKNLWAEDENLKLKSILFMTKKDIVDPAEIYMTLKKGIMNYGYEQIYKLCFLAKANYKKSNLTFDEYLKNSIERLDEESILPDIYLKKHYVSPKELRKELLENIEKMLKDTYIDTRTFSPKFLQELFTLNKDKILNLENEEIKIVIDWHKLDETTVKVYIKNKF